MTQPRGGSGLFGPRAWWNRLLADAHFTNALAALCGCPDAWIDVNPMKGKKTASAQNKVDERTNRDENKVDRKVGIPRTEHHRA